MPRCWSLRCFGAKALDDDDSIALGAGRLHYPTPTLEELGDRNPLLLAPPPERHKRMLAITNGEECDDDDGEEEEEEGRVTSASMGKKMPRFHLDAAVVTVSGVTVSGLQPVQIFEGVFQNMCASTNLGVKITSSFVQS